MSSPSPPSPPFTPSLPSPPQSTFPTLNPTTSSTGNDNNNNNQSLASSASLYLYTFLATLVLLLIVSAAIVVRSFILRRRHRLMMEEAFRNGTLPGTFTLTLPRPRVDLSKKPKLWNAWIERPEPPTSGRSRAKEWYWDMMKPFSATYTLPPSATESGTDDSSHRRGNSTSRPTLRDRVGSAARHIVYYVGARPSTNSLQGSTTPSSTQLASPMALAHLDSGNATVKIAVLIAMPRKSSTKPSSSSFSSSTSRSPGLLLSSSLSSSSPSHLLSASASTSFGDDEEPLPHLEMGVTEVRVVANADATDPDPQAQGKRSMATEY